MQQNTDKADFGDFEETTDDPKPKEIVGQEAPTRVRLPRNGEVIGIILQRLGGNRMEVKCTDGKTRNCRVPGRFKRSLWLRPKDVVLVETWEHDDGKADVIFKYHSSAINQLRKRGLLSIADEAF